MIKVSPRFVVDEIRAYDQAKASEDEQISFDQAVREIESKYKV
jgi:hypothetical protein